MRLSSIVLALCGFALVLGACGSEDRLDPRACLLEEGATTRQCTLFVGKLATGDWFEEDCSNEWGGDFKEATNCPTTGSYVGHCRFYPGQVVEYHQYYYGNWDEAFVLSLKRDCTRWDEGEWVGK